MSRFNPAQVRFLFSPLLGAVPDGTAMVSHTVMSRFDSYSAYHARCPEAGGSRHHAYLMTGSGSDTSNEH